MNEDEYNNICAEIEELMNREKLSEQELEKLISITKLVEEYEEINSPIPPPSLVEALQFIVDQCKK